MPTIFAAFIEKVSCNFCRNYTTAVGVFVLSMSSYDKTCLAALCVVNLFSLFHLAMSAKYSVYIIFKINMVE